MAVSKKISSQIGQQLPDFIRSDAPLFQSFIEGYYEYIEIIDEFFCLSKVTQQSGTLLSQFILT